MSIPISPEVLVLVGKILAITQALKRFTEIKWVAFLLEKYLKIPGITGGISIALAFLVALVAGIVQYGGDGSLTFPEVKAIVEAALLAIGGFSVLKSTFGKNGGGA